MEILGQTDGVEEADSTLEMGLPAGDHAWVLDVQDDEGSRTVPLTEGGVVIGSSHSVDVRMNDPAVSARHCALQVVEGGVYIRDLDSRNGTFVGNARVREARGGFGTTVIIGRSSITCSVLQRYDGEDAVVRPLEGVSGGSPAMRKIAAQVRRLAASSMPVLIAGESGTGKELIARALHHEGPRSAKPFIALNVAALPRELIESELFGHERGAFTGAVSRRAGAFTEAEGGTLFLDEIGELPLEAQPKLLRAVDGYEVRRVGSAGGGFRTRTRIIAATHVPLGERVTKGLFRRDLYHRLEVFVVTVPALRERRGDIGVIARALLRDVSSEFGRRDLTSSAIARLSTHDWPGNVRELRNALYRAVDLAGNTRALDASIIDRVLTVRARPSAFELTPALARNLYIQCKENMSEAARVAGYPRSSFRKLLRS